MAPRYVACHNGSLGIAQLLLLRRQPSRAGALAVTATAEGHHKLAAWLVRSRLWSTLHHLEFLTPERALALRAGADIHAAAEPGGPTPLSLAQAAGGGGRRGEGTAAFLVLEAAKPWSRKTHKYFPEPARARAIPELWPWGFRFSRRFPREQAMYDVWMTIVMGQAVTRNYGRFGPTPIGNPDCRSASCGCGAP